MTEFGKNLRAILERRGISLNRLAFWSDVSVSSLCRYISGERYPTLAFALRIADALDVSLDTLFNGKDYEKLSIGEIRKLTLSQKQKLKKILKKTGRSIPEMKELRYKTGLTCNEFARHFGITVDQLHAWESEPRDVRHALRSPEPGQMERLRRAVDAYCSETECS